MLDIAGAVPVHGHELVNSLWLAKDSVAFVNRMRQLGVESKVAEWFHRVVELRRFAGVGEVIDYLAVEHTQLNYG